MRYVIGTAAAGGVAAVGFAWLRSGALTLDVGIGRTVRPLGPISRHIRAPREVVFDVIAQPYLGRTPRAMESKLRVLERGSDMVLAEHFTPTGSGRVSTTVETVRFERPHRVSFRLVRGPVPHVTETFELESVDDGCALRYAGELGTDFWGLGRAWGERVAKVWEAAVQSSLDSISTEAERRAAADPVPK
jgi:Polyketide cyclase / dehydrase and lipid transport